jgi:hypothetical protein
MNEVEELEIMTFHTLDKVRNLGQEIFDKVFTRGSLEFYRKFMTDNPEEAEESECHRRNWFPDAAVLPKE